MGKIDRLMLAVAAESDDPDAYVRKKSLGIPNGLERGHSWDLN